MVNIRDVFLNMQDIILKYEFPQEQNDVLSRYAKKFISDENLLALAEKYYTMIFEQEVIADVNTLKEEDGMEQGMLFAMIYLARCAVFSEVLAQKGIPEKYACTAIWHYKDLFRRSFACYDCYGFSGMYRKGMIQYIKPTTFRIGRLSFEMQTFSGPYTVYQNKKTKKTIPLVDAGYGYLPNGKQKPQDYADETFVTEVYEDAETIKGYSVCDDGTLNFEQITLEKNDYDVALQKGDAVLSVHIPGNEKLTEEWVAQSFEEAKCFFDTYYKQAGFKAFVCSSWLLDTGLVRVLDEKSNILKFQKNFKIVLSFVNTFSLYWNVFGIEKFIPRAELVPTNAFQRKILELLDKGEKMYSGNGYIPYGDIIM